MTHALLLSGGMDSLSLACWRRPDVAITIDYGQRPANAEITAVRAFCSTRDIRHNVVAIDCSALGSGDLAAAPALPDAPASDWWPFRNQLLVTIAASRALALGINTLEIGTVASDGTHADGRPGFISALDRLTSMQEGRVRVVAPAIEMTTTGLVRASGIALEELAWSHSCHTGNIPCGCCRGCFKHLAVWAELSDGLA